jgi:serine/threonine protein phosphatase PrpC
VIKNLVDFKMNSVCRAIGDVSLQPYVTCEPEITSKALSDEDEYVVLASDGVWDVLSNEDVARLVKMHLVAASTATGGSAAASGAAPAGVAGGALGVIGMAGGNKSFANCAQHICAEALLMGSTDNVTVLVLDLK